MDNQYLQTINGDLWLTEDERENLKISYRIKEVFFQSNPLFNMLWYWIHMILAAC